MKNDFQSLCVAEVEVAKVRFSKGPDTGIDFSNAIDAWTKMEFKFRKQIMQLRQQSSNHDSAKSGMRDLHPLVYSFRQRID